MLVTFGTKRVNTVFVQIFGSKILKDFGQPFFQQYFFFRLKVIKQVINRDLKKRRNNAFFHDALLFAGKDQRTWSARRNCGQLPSNDPRLRSGNICDTVKFARTQSSKKRTNVSRYLLIKCPIVIFVFWEIIKIPWTSLVKRKRTPQMQHALIK